MIVYIAIHFWPGSVFGQAGFSQTRELKIMNISLCPLTQGFDSHLPPVGIILVEHVKDHAFVESKSCLATWQMLILAWVIIKMSFEPNCSLKRIVENKSTHNDYHYTAGLLAGAFSGCAVPTSISIIPFNSLCSGKYLCVCISSQCTQQPNRSYTVFACTLHY